MPKAASSQTMKKGTTGLLILKHNKKRIIVPRPVSYAAALDAAHKHFPGIPRGEAALQTADLDICGGEMAEVSAESWADVIGFVSSITVAEKAPSTVPVLPPPSTLSGKADRINIRVNYRQGIWNVRPSGSTLIEKIIKSVGLQPHDVRAIHSGSVMYMGTCVNDYDMLDDNEIILIDTQVGGKPVIYLFSPTVLDVSVTLSLVTEWSLSVLYPVVPTKSLGNGRGEQVQWNVRVHPDGTLTETNTNLGVAYLFWEALTNSGTPISPPPSPTLSMEHFSPSSSTLSDSDSALLAVKGITPYLNKALQALGLHTEARTSFITYWLPSFLKHEYVALRFVPQASYSRAAPLDIVPAPDVVTRVFMLFKGIPVDSLMNWSGAAAKAETDVGLWRNVVGVDLEKTLDTQLFRVLEWGGMEVLGS